jgi:phospholipid/cholesterol/gamma-HCH transport system substrate-binding protein
MRTKLSRNALIGLAFIASLVMIYFGINFLKGIMFSKNRISIMPCLMTYRSY